MLLWGVETAPEYATDEVNKPAADNHISVSISVASGTTQVVVNADGVWENTGIQLRPGDQITITASGVWTPGPPGGIVGPDGASIPWPDNFLNRADIGVCGFCATTRVQHWGALIGYIGDNPPQVGSYVSQNVLPEANKVFLVGSSFVTRTVLAGTLWLNINDDAYSGNTMDNDGELNANAKLQTLDVTPTRTPTITPTPTLLPGLAVLTLQNGLLGYQGTTDTWIDSFNPDTINGVGSAGYFLRLYPDNQQNILLRFDLSPVIPSLPIHQAVLQLYVGSRTNSNTIWADAYELHRTWKDMEATWNRAQNGEPWELPGANGPGDRSQVSSGLMIANLPEGAWVSLDVTNLVKKWLVNPETNHGIVLIGRPGGGVQYTFRSANHPDQIYRPKLLLYYWQIQVTSTPTATPTPTHTPTRTPTPRLTPTPTPTDARLGSFLYMEAERGVKEWEMRSYFDQEASACLYAASPFLNGRLTLTFRIDRAGNYWLWGRTKANHEGENSIYVSVNDTPAFRWDFPLTSEWTWNPMRDTATGLRPFFALGASTHTIAVWPREAGSKLDVIGISSNANDTPDYYISCASILTPEPTSTPTTTPTHTPTVTNTPTTTPTHTPTVTNTPTTTATPTSTSHVSLLPMIQR